MVLIHISHTCKLFETLDKNSDITSTYIFMNKVL